MSGDVQRSVPVVVLSRIFPAARPSSIPDIRDFAHRGELDPFVLVVEGFIPNEAIKEEGYWCGFGNNPATGQPMTANEWAAARASADAAVCY